MTVAYSNISSDPCYNYESLDRPWRANNESGVHICEERFSWNGWYRLFYYGMNIQMPETCVSSYSCNTHISLWLNGSHPQIEDGVVNREVCGNYYSGGCCDYKTNPIRVKACPGNYYVYELVKPQIGCSGYCTDVTTISQPNSTESPNIITGASNTSNYDPCNNYNILDNHRRSTLNYWSMYGSANGLDDTRLEWDGWYRLFINGASAQMPESCFYYMSCGGYSALYLGGSHPRLEDGVVTREIYGSLYDQCSRYRSEPIQVKACPGNYYVYKFTRPTLSIPAPVYCAALLTTPNVDPCYNYTSLDEPWRATDHSNILKCDYNVEWNGWYRMFYNGQNTQMTESCVNHGMCGTHYPLSLSGPHPQLEDGVVTRQVCFSVGGCCAYRSHPIRVKACPGNYYVYEFVKPIFCGAYCVEIFYPFGSAAGDTINAAVDDGSSSVIQLLSPFLFFGRTYQQIYVNNNGHLTFNQPSSSYVPYSFPARGSQDIIAGLWTNLDNSVRGVVSYHQYTSGNVLTRATRDINTHFPNLTFTASWVFVATWNKVSYFNLTNTETSFQVVLISGGNFSFLLMNYGDIAVTGHPVQAGYDTVNSTHYFVIPESINGSFISNLRNSSNVNVLGRWVFRVDGEPRNSILNIAYSNISSDPCYNYESLDRPWRANNESGVHICDEGFSWNGWYRLFYYGMNIQMPETCVSSYTCNTHISLWLNGSHPQIEDGVVTRQACGNYYSGGCCYYKTNPIRVKACPGNYYVYELVKPQIGCSGYCTDVSTISRPISTISPKIITGASNTSNYDPCNNYNILDNYRRSTLNYGYWFGYANGLDDTRVEWDGWYRLFVNGASAQMPEWCFYYMSCGGFSALYLGGSHPRLEDGVVTREIYGSRYHQCSYYRSEPIQVKACPGNYYVYKFTRPPLSIPAPVYCAVLLTTPSVDPCYNYTSLDEPWRATDHSNILKCDYNVEWNGWYRMFYNGQNTQMTESCVNHGMCGTHYPLSLNGPHPQLEDGVVTRQVCFSVGGCCAYRSHPIRVKACPGNYYVYEFVKP
uniref:NIDO domain-containing protein n=1 Tax=Cyprinus carpio TaxID=7962 RepID=A0A8C2ARH6_CYPCA